MTVASLLTFQLADVHFGLPGSTHAYISVVVDTVFFISSAILGPSNIMNKKVDIISNIQQNTWSSTDSDRRSLLSVSIIRTGSVNWHGTYQLQHLYVSNRVKNRYDYHM